MAYQKRNEYSSPEKRKKKLEEEKRNFKIGLWVTIILFIFFLALIFYLIFFMGKKPDEDFVPTSVITTQATTLPTTAPTTASTVTSTATTQATTEKVKATSGQSVPKATVSPTKAVDATPSSKSYDDGISVSFTASETSKWYMKLIGPYSDPLPRDYKPSLSNVEGYSIHSKIVSSYKAMKAAAANDGISIYIVSGYRSYQTQEKNFNNRYNQYKNQGYSDKDAYAKTASIIAVPGTSEHHLGLAMDLNSLYQSFGNTATGKWLAKNSYKYGFILRYASDTTGITGIVYEPWHFRYVTVEHAKKIHELGITLEEYVDWLNQR